MLEAIGGLFGALVEVVASAVFAVARSLFRWEASVARPAWVRLVAIGIILAVSVFLFSILLSIFAFAFYAALAVAAVIAVVAFFASN